MGLLGVLGDDHDVDYLVASRGTLNAATRAMLCDCV